MLQFEVLKKRFGSVERHQTELSILDAFLLLTTARIDQNWQASEKKSALKQFGNWQFVAKTPLQRQIYIQVIEWMLQHVSKDLFIQQLDHQFNWYEQWMQFYLHQQTLPKVQLIAVAKTLEQRRVSNHHEALLQYLAQQVPCFDIMVILAEFYVKQNCLDQALIDYQILLQQYCHAFENYQRALYGFVCALLRRNGQYSTAINDAEYALNILLKVAEGKVWNKEFTQLLIQAQDQALLDSLKHSRRKALGSISSIGRGVSLFGKKIGTTLGGKESALPYSKIVVDAAPVLLSGAEIEKNMNRNIRLNHSLSNLLKQRLPDHEAAIASLGLSLGSFWTYSQIDSRVLDAISFASSGTPDDFGDLQDIGDHTLHSAGAVTRLTGYVAEQQVALNLVREGHTVEVPDSATQPGWDLLVDGSPVQIKCTLDANYVLHHFDKNPDIAVIVNHELAAELGHHPLVTIDPHLSYAEIQQTTHSSLQHLDDFGSLHELLSIPLLSIAFAAHRHSGLLAGGQADVRQYGINVSTEVAIRTAGAVSGKLIGGAIGSLAGPVGTIIGAGVFAYIGGLAGGTGADALLREEICNQRDVLVKELLSFARWFNQQVVTARLQQMQAQHKKFKQKVTEQLQRQAAFSEQPIYAQLLAVQHEQMQRVQSLFDWLNTQLQDTEFYQAQAGWVALRESGKFFHADMKVKVARLNDALERYQAMFNPERAVGTAVVVV